MSFTRIAPFAFALTLVAALVLLTSSAHAALITWEFDNDSTPGGDLNGTTTEFDFAKDGVTITLFDAVSSNGSAGMFDNNNTGLGVDNDRLEANESFSFKFDQTVFLDTIFLSTNRNDVEYSSTAFSTSPLTFATNPKDFGLVEIPAGTAVTLSRPSGAPGAGRLGSITINTIPEPASLALLGLGGLMMIGRRRAAKRTV